VKAFTPGRFKALPRTVTSVDGCRSCTSNVWIVLPWRVSVDHVIDEGLIFPSVRFA